MKDFFFGEVNTDRKCAEMSLHRLAPLTKKVPPQFFTDQVNRLLAATNQRLTVTDGTSMPSFAALVRSLTAQAVGFIEIYARTDVNPNVDATLACDLWLDQGIVSMVPHWCAYKDTRASEIISTLLLPLHLKGWASRTYLRWDNDETLPLVPGGDYVQEVEDVFTLAKYPSIATFDEDSRNRTKRYAQDLQDASAIGSEDLEFDQAREKLDQARFEAGRLS